MLDQLIIDGHVHIHDCFPLDRFLDGASANFDQVAHELAAPAHHGLLLLTESAGVDVFGDLYRQIDETPSGPSHWRFERTAEANSLRAQGPHGQIDLIARPIDRSPEIPRHVDGKRHVPRIAGRLHVPTRQLRAPSQRAV